MAFKYINSCTVYTHQIRPNCVPVAFFNMFYGLLGTLDAIFRHHERLNPFVLTLQKKRLQNMLMASSNTILHLTQILGLQYLQSLCHGHREAHGQHLQHEGGQVCVEHHAGMVPDGEEDHRSAAFSEEKQITQWKIIVFII